MRSTIGERKTKVCKEGRIKGGRKRVRSEKEERKRVNERQARDARESAREKEKGVNAIFNRPRKVGARATIMRPGGRCAL